MADSESINPYVSNWHIDLIADYLQACATGQIHRLIINIPPKGMKSTKSP